MNKSENILKNQIADEVVSTTVEETDLELLNKLKCSEIDIDEFVIRSIRKIEASKNEDSHPSSINEADVADVYTVNSKLLPSLTEQFRLEIPQEILLPDFTSLTPKNAVECLGEITGILDHEVNFISFWILDTLAGCLQRVQNKGLDPKNQRVFITWFGFFLKTLSVHGWTREVTFTDFKKLILVAKEMIEKENFEIPSPFQCLATLNRTPSVQSSKSRLNETNLSQKRSDSNSKTGLPKRRSSSRISKRDKNKSSHSICSNITGETSDTLSKNLTELEVIAEVIYEIFANRFKFETIKSAFNSASHLTTVCLPNPLHLPKCLEPQQDIGLKRAKDKKEIKGKTKEKKNKNALPPKEEPPIEIIHSDQYILPLSTAKEVNKQFFASLFPEHANAVKKQPKTKEQKSKKKK